ncbi:MAG TPA: ferric reductase-like transmembrane domain-containing protein [Candidatus Dormibacteraeota bacterium]|nr:ferric reductase-like transmembrane domain-containing protein [Candidatus Dormibacteraeota bacterium]
MSDIVLWYTTRGAGAVSMILLSAVVILGVLSSLRFQGAGWPRFLTPALHRNLALMTLVFLALHIVTAVVDPFTHLGWLTAVVPFSSYYRTFWLGLGTIAFELLAAIVVTSLLRGLIGQAAWRAIHWLAYASWPVAVLHGFGTGTDALSGWFMVVSILCIGSVAMAIVYRILRPSTDPLTSARSEFRSGVSRKTDQ